MARTAILAAIDSELERLQQARSLLTGDAKPGRDRPKAMATVVKPVKKRNISPEGRKLIVEAVKRRWAAKKKAAGK
jgi:hypothetical protein